MTNQTYRLVNGYYSWEQVTATALNYPAHTDILVGLDMVPPLPTYFKKIHADNDGQKSNYGFSLPDKRGIHVKVYDDYYKVHWDKRSSLTDPLGHLYHDAPHWIVILIIGLSVVAITAVAVKKWKK
jgi:hypothetical protein